MLGMCTKIDSDFSDCTDSLRPPPTITPPPSKKKKKCCCPEETSKGTATKASIIYFLRHKDSNRDG